jgi:hypothetical protein
VKRPSAPIVVVMAGFSATTTVSTAADVARTEADPNVPPTTVPSRLMPSDGPLGLPPHAARRSARKAITATNWNRLSFIDGSLLRTDRLSLRERPVVRAASQQAFPVTGITSGAR